MNLRQTILNRIRQVSTRLASYRLIRLTELHSVWEQEQLRKLLPYYSVDCVFDVGAHYGQYALMLRSKAKFKGLIISFEPIPAAAAALRTMSANDPMWVVEECALSKTNGEQTFNIMSGTQFSSLSDPRHDEVDLFRNMNKINEKTKVRTETLNCAFDRLHKAFDFKRPFLKMDTQGFDVDVFTHGMSVVRQFVGLQSELAVKKLYKDSVDFREAISVYEQCGFSLSAFVPNNAGNFPRLIEVDCIMVRNDLLGNSPC